MELLTCTIVTSDTANTQKRKMADYNLLLIAVLEDTHKSEPTNQNNKPKTLL